jgi:putative transposase
MAASLYFFTALKRCFRTAALALLDLGRLVALMARSRSALSAENLFLRKQLALFQERRVNPAGPTIPRDG